MPTTASCSRCLFAMALFAGLSLHTGCSSTAKRARPRAEAPTENLVARDLPSILRGTIGSMATLRGHEPLLVTGYGIVVGLSGSGSADLPMDVRSTLEREMALKGVGSDRLGMGWISPTEMLNDLNTAAVLVQGQIPPGARKGNNFDIRVSAYPGSATTSLEHGSLWTTQLRRGFVMPSGSQTAVAGDSSGPVYINPYADENDDIVRTAGRIIGGGRVTQDRPLHLVMDNPNHARVIVMADAINQRFPRQRGQERVARGLNEELIEITVPKAYRNDSMTFIQLLLHTRMDPTFPEQWAIQYARALKEEPRLAEELSWCLQSLGPTALPALRELYTYSEARPRLAALRAGAALHDALAAPHLQQISIDGPKRIEAIKLLGGMDPDPKIDLALRRLLDNKAVDIRVAAYESLRDRGSRFVRRRNIEGKFFLHTVPSTVPMLFVTEHRQPGVVIFGNTFDLPRPLLATAWNDRLMVAADTPNDPIRVYYKNDRTGEVVKAETDSRIDKFIRFLAHEPTPESPEPGLNLSYAGVVGALHELAREDALPGLFVPEQDKLGAELLRSLREDAPALDRPETIAEAEARKNADPFDPFAQMPGARARSIKPDQNKDKDDDAPTTDTDTPNAGKPKPRVIPLQPRKKNDR